MGGAGVKHEAKNVKRDTFFGGSGFSNLRTKSANLCTLKKNLLPDIFCEFLKEVHLERDWNALGQIQTIVKHSES